MAEDEKKLVALLLNNGRSEVLGALPSLIQEEKALGSFFTCLTQGDGATAENQQEVLSLCFRVLEQGELNHRASSNFVGSLLPFIDRIIPSVLVGLLTQFLDMLKTGGREVGSGRTFELYPKVLEVVSRQQSISGLDDSLVKQGAEFKNFFLSSLCSKAWPARCIVNLVTLLRDVPLTDEQLKFALKKLFDSLGGVELEELPSIVYQALLLSAKGHKQLVLSRINELFFQLEKQVRSSSRHRTTDASAEEDELVPTQERAVTTERLRAVQGTIMLHITFAMKQDQDLGKEFLKYLKVCGQYTVFTAALALSLSRINRFEEPVNDFFKSAILTSFKDKERARSLPAVGGTVSITDWEGLLMGAVRSGVHGWDQAVQGLVRLASMLIDSFKYDSLNGSGASRASPSHQCCRLGIEILFAAFQMHEAVRGEIVQLLLARVVSKSTAHYTHHLDLLSRLVQNCAQYLHEGLGKIKEAFAYLSFMSTGAALGLLDALMPLVLIHGTVRDDLVLVLRKGLFSREAEARAIALGGFVRVLRAVGADEGGEAPSSQTTRSTDALCLEIMANLRRCFSQQADVRAMLYKELVSVASTNAALYQLVLDNTTPHVAQYISVGPDDGVPLNLNLCFSSSAGDKMVVTERLDYLLGLVQVLLSPALVALHGGVELDNIAFLSETLNALCNRLLKCEFADFDLDKNADYTGKTSVGVRNYQTVVMLLGVHEALLGVVFDHKDGLSIDAAQRVISLFRKMEAFNEVIKDPLAASKGSLPQHISLRTLSLFMSALLADCLPNHNASLCILRSRHTFVRYIARSFLNQIKEFQSSEKQLLVGAEEDEFVQNCIRAATAIVTDLSRPPGASLIVKVKEDKKENRARHMSSLLLEGLSAVIVAFHTRLPSHLSSLVAALHGALIESSDSTHVAPEDVPLGDGLMMLLTWAQREFLTHLSQNEPRLASSVLVLLTAILSCEEALPSSKLHSHALQWMNEICLKHIIDDSTCCKSLVSMFLLSHALGPDAALSLLHHLSLDLKRQLDTICDENDAKGQVQYQVVTPEVAQNGLILLAVLASLSQLLEGVDWTISKLSAIAKKEESEPDSSQISVLRDYATQTLNGVMLVLGEIVNTAFENRSCLDVIFRTFKQFYTVMTSLARFQLVLSSRPDSDPPATSFQQLVFASGPAISNRVYNMVTFWTQATFHAAAPNPSKKGKKSASVPAGLGKEATAVPNLIFAIEQYEKILIQLSKKAGVNFMKTMKRSTARDFRIEVASIENALEKGEEAPISPKKEANTAKKTKRAPAKEGSSKSNKRRKEAENEEEQEDGDDGQ